MTEFGLAPPRYTVSVESSSQPFIIEFGGLNAQGLAQYAPMIALVGVPLLYVLRRPLLGGVTAAARVARGAARWWALWKVGSRAVAHLPNFVRR